MRKGVGGVVVVELLVPANFTGGVGGVAPVGGVALGAGAEGAPLWILATTESNEGGVVGAVTGVTAAASTPAPTAVPVAAF